MFTIYGGKTEFNQWEKDHRVVNPNMSDCEQVAFRMSNGRTGVSRAYEHEGQMVADVPNHLLKYSGNMMVELGQGKNLRIEETTYFPVTKTEKPEEYEETENRNLKKKYIETVKQDLTEAEKEQARENLGINGTGGGATTWDELEGKPFGEEEIIVLPETQLTFADMGGGMMGTIVELATAPSAMGAYTVIYNGEAYSCQPMVLTTTDFAIGNVGYFTGGESTGEPFVVVIAGTTAQIVSVGAESSATISIKSLTTVPIPAKYAPKAVVIDLSGDEFPAIRTNVEVEFNLSNDIYNELITANEQGVIRLNVRYSNIKTMVPSDSLKSGTTCIVASIFHQVDKAFIMEALLWDNFVCFETTDSKTFTAITKRLAFETNN